MNILITHESSGVMREAFRALGHDAYSCDLLPADDGSRHHIQMNALIAIRACQWDLIGMHPPCTYLTGAGIHWNNRGRGWEKTEEALQHVKDCFEAAKFVPHYLENPVGIISTRIQKPDQIIQPYDFQEDASKATCLWLSGLPALRSTGYVKPRFVCKTCKTVSTYEQAEQWRDSKGICRCHKCADSPRLLPRWSNQTDSGQNKLPPSATRWKERSKTHPGIAKAAAAQWSEYLQT